MKMLICSLLVLAGFVSAFSQEKTIDKAEFDAINQPSMNPILRWKGRAFRQTITTETRALERPSTDYAAKMVTEFGSEGDTHATTNSVFGGKASEKRQSIRIGDVRFSRVGEGEWTKSVEAPSSPKTDSAAPPPSYVEEISIQSEYKFLGTELYKNKSVRTYLRTDKRLTVSKEYGSTSEALVTTKYWFDQDGTLLKSDYRSNSTTGEKNYHTNIVMEWELDPSISIAAPIADK